MSTSVRAVLEKIKHNYYEDVSDGNECESLLLASPSETPETLTEETLIEYIRHNPKTKDAVKSIVGVVCDTLLRNSQDESVEAVFRMVSDIIVSKISKYLDNLDSIPDET